MKKFIILISAFVLIAVLFLPITTYATDYSMLSLSEDDEKLLAALCYAETKGEPYLSKVCFCAMMLNRLQNKYFPDTVRGVVFDCGAFESAMSGSLSSIAENEVLSRELLALKTVLRKNLDPTGNSLFTMKKDDVELWQLRQLFVIEDRVFGVLN